MQKICPKKNRHTDDAQDPKIKKTGFPKIFFKNENITYTSSIYCLYKFEKKKWKKAQKILWNFSVFFANLANLSMYRILKIILFHFIINK